MPPDSLLPAFTQLRLSTPREAQLLHEEESFLDTS